MLPLASFGQRIYYSYDAAGNRVQRQMASRGSQAPRKKSLDTQMSEQFSQSVSVGPNPTNGPLDIRLFRWNGEDQCHLLLSNTAGQVLADRTVTSALTTLDLSTCPSGYYLLQVELNGETETYKIIRK